MYIYFKIGHHIRKKFFNRRVGNNMERITRNEARAFLELLKASDKKHGTKKIVSRKKK